MSEEPENPAWKLVNRPKVYPDLRRPDTTQPIVCDPNMIDTFKQVRELRDTIWRYFCVRPIQPPNQEANATDVERSTEEGITEADKSE